MPDFVADYLREHVDAHRSPDRLVFTSAEGTPLRHRNFMWRHFKPAVVRAEGAAMEQVK